MELEPIEELKIMLREEQSPFFSDQELYYYLEKYHWNIHKTAYHCLLLKAENDSFSLPAGLKLPDNRQYWLSLANRYRPNYSQIVKGTGDKEE